MNKSQIFTKAHKMAKGAIRNGKFQGNYRKAFSWATKKVFAEQREIAHKALRNYTIGNITIDLASFCKTEMFICATVAQMKEAKRKLVVARQFTTVENGVTAELIEVTANGITQNLFWNSAIKTTQKLSAQVAAQAWEAAYKIA